MHRILVQLAQTNTWTIAAISALGAIFGALAGGLATYMIEKEKNKTLKIQKQWEVFSKLKGIQAILPQDYITHYTNIIFTINQEAAARLHTEEENQRLHLEEARRMNASSYESSRLFAKDRQELYELIGSIMILFPNDQELHEKINPIYSQLTVFESEFEKAKLMRGLEPLIPHIFDDLKTWNDTFDRTKAGEYFKKLDGWKAGKTTRINSLAIEIVFRQLDGLLNHLLTEIHMKDESI